MGMFLKKTRFHHSLKLITEMKGRQSLCDISYTLGYYDQAHFIHDFKRFAGITPKQYLTSASTRLNSFFESIALPSVA
jgi:AraC-like DNA-binding protein